MDALLSVGDIIIDINKQAKYLVVAIVNDEITLCDMNTTKFKLTLMDKTTLIVLIDSGDLVKEREPVTIFNIDSLSDAFREKFKMKKQMMMEVVDMYGPLFMDLNGKKRGRKLQEIMEKYHLTRCSFWRICTAYFQSGMQDYSLVDSRYFGVNTGKTYNYSTKTGRPAEYLENSGIVITNEIKQYFEEALKDYKSGRYKSVKDAFDRMNLLHFTKTEIVNGVPSMVLLPSSERPTLTQLRYFFNKHLTNQEKDLIKTSAMEQRNNKRILTSDVLNSVRGPGDLVEIDACEADISLVSAFDPTKTVGRPIVYFMIDVYSRIILAVSVAFDNNSMLGLSNLFLNLADDKQEYCSRYGITYDNPMIWPSNIIPNEVRVDRGAEFRSKEFARICEELHIKQTLVLPGSGSLKGVVEQSFRQLHINQNVHLEDRGLIQKRHRSNHHETATLNIEEYTKMVIGFVLSHNQKSLETYPLNKDMVLKKIKPIPALLWEYGLKNCYTPRPITSKEQYFFNLMTPINARVSRKGIMYKDLWYVNQQDPFLCKEMFDAGTKRVPFDARMDMRDVGSIYYIRNNKLMRASLNNAIHGNIEFNGLTMKQYEDFLKYKKELLKSGRVGNEELSAFVYALNNSIVADSVKNVLPDAKNMRPTREIEKQMKSKSNKISNRLAIDDEIPQLQQPSNSAPTALDTYSSWEEALEDW